MGDLIMSTLMMAIQLKNVFVFLIIPYSHSPVSLIQFMRYNISLTRNVIIEIISCKHCGKGWLKTAFSAVLLIRTCLARGKLLPSNLLGE
jgi:hypothetical protein